MKAFKGWMKTLESKLGIGKTSLADLISRSNYKKIDDLIILNILHSTPKNLRQNKKTNDKLERHL